MKKLGEYLIENNLCDEASLDSALQEQAELKSKGIFKPLGTLLTDLHAVSPKDIDNVISRMHLNILSSSVIFQNTSREALQKTLSRAKLKTLPEDSVIFSQGDVSESFFIVISGTVKIFRTSDDNQESIIAYLKDGEGFGEVSLLTGEPHSSSARTLKPTSLLVFTKKGINSLIASDPDISLALIKGFASRLNKKDEEIVKANEKEKAYQQFVSQESELSLPDLIGQTRTINNLRKKIHEAAENDLPALVSGEPGTEKLVVAGTIHKNSDRSSAPFLSMDAEDITIEGYGAIPDTDSDTLQLEMAQNSVLFGYEKGAFAFSQTRGLGLLQICRQGTVVIENVDKLTKGVQQKLHDFLVHGTFETVGGQRQISSEARIIATTTVDLKNLVEEEKFNPQLLELLSSSNMKVPPIRKRKSDLRLLVDFIIIMECFKTPDRKIINGMSPEAYQRIMEYDWPGNMDELQIVIRRAINLAHTDYLLPEDIFIGMAPPEGKYTFNLLQLEQVRNFFRHRFYPVGIQALTGAFFSLIFLFAFLGNQSPDANVTLLLVWAMWWPMLALSWFFGARIWCSICPMGAVNDLLNKFCSLKRKVPKFIRNNSTYLSLPHGHRFSLARHSFFCDIVRVHI
jgi:transcriptional regulator with GAF, ATPase, and Fis domain